MDAVGYDMYIKLLNEAVLEEKGEIPVEVKECKMDIPLDAYIPESYIFSSAGRMEMYKKIALIETSADLDDVADELFDRYGEFGRPVHNLMQISLVRHMAQRAGLTLVRVQNGEINLFADRFDVARWSVVAYEWNNRLRFITSAKTYLSYRLRKNEEAVDILARMLGQYENANQDE